MACDLVSKKRICPKKIRLHAKCDITILNAIVIKVGRIPYNHLMSAKHLPLKLIIKKIFT